MSLTNGLAACALAGATYNLRFSAPDLWKVLITEPQR
eukprot:CAMPEP_0182453982 /NCGR_PEP_ID=MMETSP1319-20130603/809_1 /TAXON_ID=172717 /ORGANISM="Bolidomonas pacifica, Strain RCC208" /LENGTH=36 /DNA_ID= /DNA_START= /DNA_END= /DNA_ORIENTATION=